MESNLFPAYKIMALAPFKVKAILVDLNEFSSVVKRLQHSHSRHQKTTSNLIRIKLNGTLRFSTRFTLQRPLEGAMYIVHKPVVKFSGASQNIFLEISQNLMVLYKTIHKAFRIHKTLKINKTH